jgi:hypothetical protein
MKRIIRIVAGAAVSLVGVSAYAQVEAYYYSGSIVGQADIGLNPGAGYGGGIEIYFGAVSETLYYNPSADTIQEVGTFTVTPSGGNFNMTQLGVVGASPVGSGTLTVGNNGVVSFNTTFTFGGGSFPNMLGGELDIPVSGSGTYNGQAFQGNWNVDLPLVIDIENVSPGSLTFTQTTGDGATIFGFLGSKVVDGLYDGYGGDNTIDYSWLQDPVASAAVPDTTDSIALLGLALVPLTLCRRFLRTSGSL